MGDDRVGDDKTSEEARRYYQQQGGQASPERVVPASATSQHGAREDVGGDGRQSERDAMRGIAEHMEVVGRDGVHVGTVDKVRGDDIVLTRSDPAAGGVHHLIPGAWIQGVGEKVMLNRKGDEARAQWMPDARDRPAPNGGRDDNSLALGESPKQGSDGPHILDRSFAGTYDK